MSDKSKKNIDPKPIKDLAKILEELNLTEVSYSDGDFSVSVAKGARLQLLIKIIQLKIIQKYKQVKMITKTIQE